ncbi:hypothetical protein ILUMI_22060 [Ignelater luminosus]|uniref:Protein THEM6 n=1 Tax=Ignelater luminosus TaxID=2038154 RepID=A0A8K0CHG3_IGNLU|nr:hypothetical protein ILUMI_22060 [Ignelater luminosus]
MFCYVIGVFALIIIVLYGLIELHYFLRTCFSVILARFFKEKVSVLQETTVKGLYFSKLSFRICLTTDIDTFLYHMNNARFMRELDFARADFYERTGLYRCIRSKNGGIAVGATTIRYRRFVRLFSRYIITSKVVYWDEQGIYMEHRFITPRDNFVNAIAVCKTRLLNCNVDEVMNELLSVTEISGMENGTKLKPPMPPEVAKWIESNEISSAILRNLC